MRLKKLASIIIALLLAASLSMPVFATEDYEETVAEETEYYEEEALDEETEALDEETTVTENDDETVEQKETTTSKDGETTTASDSETTTKEETTEGKANSSSDTVATTNDSGATEIYSLEDFMQIKSNPSGNYKLMVDIDMQGESWSPISFSGTLDGNNHAILNVSVTSFADGEKTVYDGNYVEYDAVFSGFFGSLENATISNLKILGIDVDVTSDKDCFVGLLSGYMENSKVDGVEIEGQAKVEAKASCFGVGGFVGFGNGSIKNSKNEVTLISVDNDAENRDEEFLGGAYAAGYIDLDSNEVKISGFDSEHGYVHSGGLVGMYALDPENTSYAGYITNNYVSGKITFFEDNTDRRAYCEPFCGEIMNWTFDYDGNTDDFTADERQEYDKTLLPEMCENPEYDEKTVESDCEQYGYTEHTCKTCDYSYKSDYKPLAHSLGNFETVKDPTVDEEGVAEAKCSKCGTIVYEELPKLTAEEAETYKEAANAGKGLGAGWIILIVVVVIAIILFILYNINKRKQEELRRKKMQRRKAALRNRGGAPQRRGEAQRRPGENSSGRRPERSSGRRSEESSVRRPEGNNNKNLKRRNPNVTRQKSNNQRPR